jgi:kynurenine formamidase
MVLVGHCWRSLPGARTGLAQDQAAQRPDLVGPIIDLTYAFDEATIFWPTEAGFQLERGAAGITEKGYYYAANRFSTAEHGGTHIDAPIHFFADRQTVDEVPLERLIGPGVVVDVSAQCASDPDYQIGVGDLRAWEERHGRQLVDVIVLLRTGHGRFWPQRLPYLGTAARGAEAVSQLHFPGLAPEAARWLAEQRRPLAVGIDTASIDFGQSTLFESHRMLFEHNIPAFENVAALEQLPEIDFTVIALPMKIRGGSGGPLRIVAVLP